MCVKERHCKFFFFFFCYDYATTNGLSGNLATGWYLPTVSEIQTIYSKKADINVSLAKANTFELGVNWYVSCNQNSVNAYQLDNVNFRNGQVGTASKTANGTIRAVKPSNKGVFFVVLTNFNIK